MKRVTRKLFTACNQATVGRPGVGAGRFGSVGSGKRGYVNQAQRRRATTSSSNANGGKEGLGFPVVDHHYE